MLWLDADIYWRYLELSYSTDGEQNIIELCNFLYSDIEIINQNFWRASVLQWLAHLAIVYVIAG